MALQLGIDGAYFRLGTQPAKVFLGDAVVQTVPGKPVIITAAQGDDVNFTPPSGGGSPILGYNVYVNGTLSAALEQESEPGFLNPQATFPGDDLEIAAVNSVGEGPRSDPFELTV
jgi:hypothetical protein